MVNRRSARSAVTDLGVNWQLAAWHSILLQLRCVTKPPAFVPRNSAMDKPISQSPSLNATKRLGHRAQYGGGRLSPESQLGHRVRIPTDDLDDVEKTSPRLQGKELASDTTSGKLARIFLASPVEDLLSRQRPFVKAAIGLYCILSCAVFSLGILGRLHRNKLPAISTNDRSEYMRMLNVGYLVILLKVAQEGNPLRSLPIDHILSKATSLYPAPTALDPFVLKAAAEPTGMTACLWSTDQDINSIIPWATRWTGSSMPLINHSLPQLLQALFPWLSQLRSSRLLRNTRIS